MCARILVRSVVLIMAVEAATFSGVVVAKPGQTVRPAYMAGSWYPGEPATLAKQIDDLLARAPGPTAADKPAAIISPHAGYRYSAPTAAAGYRRLQGHTYKRVIVLAFSHRAAGRYSGIDVPRDLTAYSTPLGEVPVDREVCDKLLSERLFGSHSDVDRGEHSLELQLPFLQRTIGDFTLVPLLVGRLSTQEYAEAAKAIVPWLDDDTLLIASSDFTHFGPRYGYEPFKSDVQKKLHELADQAAEPILRCDFDGFVDHLDKTKDTICGRGPITLLLRILSMQGGAKGVRASLDTSGEITGDWDNSVTYQSVVFTRLPGTLGRPERDTLLSLARRTVTAYLNGRELPNVDAAKLPPALRVDGGCFVTLENRGRLRGCIGNMIADGPLYKAVVGNAVKACRDHRFLNNPVTASEVEQLHLEISYLTPMKLVEDPGDIVVGRDGLMISRGMNRGVLLPQVAARRGWTREQFLQQTCRKAGLPLDAWKQPGTKIHSFRAEVFGESE